MPVVFPSKTPERIWTASASLRGVEMALCPGLRRSKNAWISEGVRVNPAGHPSMTTPSASPWDSPKVVIENKVPKVDPAIGIILIFSV